MGLATGVPLVGFVGRLSGKKGPEVFVRAMMILRSHRPDMQAVLVGEGPMHEELHSLIQRYALQQQVHLVGLRQDMPAVYSELDLLVSCSHTEAMPLVLMEAMACGVPAVADIQLAEAYPTQPRDAFSMAHRLAARVTPKPGDAGNTAAIDTAFAPITAGGRISTPLGRQLYQVVKMVDGRGTVQGDRQIFFAQQGGFDTHGNQVAQSAAEGEHMRLLKSVGEALACIHNALKAIGMNNAVTLFTQSDFGRTFKSNNSNGTDHAWGNHHLVMGGAVRGGRSYGTYSTLAVGGPSDVGVEAWELEGRWIPTTSVDQYAATLLAWPGADDAALNAVLPNLRNFGSARNLGFV
ncbi:MAG: DUF1501 domain-containing protein [Rubrivivax sp.]|nr:DUF1501 domain-containing protein [Rubrivivax sp.]